MKKVRQLDFEDEREGKSALESIAENRTPIALLLDGLEDIVNIGSIFRLADALRLEKVFFYRNTCDLEHKKLGRVARSTNNFTPYEEISLKKISELKDEYELIVIDKTSDSIDYASYEVQTSKPLLFVLGNEKHGVTQEVLDLSDGSVHLPMLGVNTSMNVAMASGIVLYHFYSVK
ncbi:MAG: TrmH family RNA methyltransferase [Cytophagales bacterium]|nr:TrmH family RNA methyltransferase [Cytophagales bacterium]